MSQGEVICRVTSNYDFVGECGLIEPVYVAGVFFCATLMLVLIWWIGWKIYRTKEEFKEIKRKVERLENNE